MPPTAEAIDRLHRILARPELQPPPSNPLQALLASIGDVIRSFLLSLIDTFQHAARGEETPIRLIVLGVALLAIGFLVWVVVRAVRQAIVADAELPAAALRRREQADRLWREARAAAERGDYTSASRLVYLSTLYTLDEHALLRVQEGLTNREHAQRLLRDRPDLGGVFAPLVQDYDRVRYREQAASQMEFARLDDLARRARAAV